MYYKTKYPFGLYFYSTIVLILSVFLLIKSVPLAAVLFYDFFIVIIAIWALKYSFVVSVYPGKIKIIYFNLFKRIVEISINEIEKVETQTGGYIYTFGLAGHKLRDKIIFDLVNGKKVVLTPQYWEEYQELIDLIEKIKIKTPYNNGEHP